MIGILNHYQLNNLLEEILFNSFSFVKNFSISNKKQIESSIEQKREIELYKKYLTYINSKIDDCFDTR